MLRRMSLKLEVLREFVSEYRFIAQHTSQEELRFGTDFITDLALSKLQRQKQAQEPLPMAPNVLIFAAMQILSEPRPKEITSEYGESLVRLLQKQFPLAKVSQEMAAEAIEVAYDSVDGVTVCIDMLKARISAHQMNPYGIQRWRGEMQRLIDNLTPESLSEVFDQLYEESRNGEEPLSGYAVHVLLKMVFDENHPLPQHLICSIEELDASIKACLRNIELAENPTRLIEVVFATPRRKNRILFQNVDKHALFHYVIECLCDSSSEKWTIKNDVIVALLEILNQTSQMQLAASLAAAIADPTTRDIGESCSKALSAKTLAEAYPSYYRLRELIPNIDIEQIFEHSFPDFEDPTASIYDDPPFIRRLNFHESPVSVYEDLVIGMSRPADNYKTIIAFNKNNSRLLWGIELPLDAKPLYQQLYAEGLTLGFENDSTLHFYHSQTGIETPAPLPIKLKNDDFIHVTPNKFCFLYSRHQHVIYGGNLLNGRWHPAFRIKAMPGSFCPLGNFIRLHNEMTQTVISQDGSVREFPHCTDMQIKNGKLFKIECDPKDPSKLTLSMDSVKQQKGLCLIGKPLKMPIPSGFAILDICDDDTVVGHQKTGLDKKAYFVDIAKQQQVEIKQKLSTCRTAYVDTRKTAVWTWDEITGTVQKHTQAGSENKGKLHAGKGTSFLHVDWADRLYIL